MDDDLRDRLAIRDLIENRVVWRDAGDAALLTLDAKLLASFPEGYRHLAYLQSQIGYKIKPDMPGLKDDAVAALCKRRSVAQGRGAGSVVTVIARSEATKQSSSCATSGLLRFARNDRKEKIGRKPCRISSRSMRWLDRPRQLRRIASR
jgi:hypothetical protein